MFHNPHTDQESVLSETGEDNMMTSQPVTEGTQKDTSDSVQLEKLLEEKRQHAALISQTRVRLCILICLDVLYIYF